MSKLLKAGFLGCVSLMVAACGPSSSNRNGEHDDPHRSDRCELIEYCDGTSEIIRSDKVAPDACIKYREPFICDSTEPESPNPA